MATKFSAWGTQLQIGDGGGPEVFTTVAQVRDVGGPSLSLDALDVTTHDSPEAWREFIGGLKDGGEVSLELVWDPDSVTQAAARADLESRTVRNFKMVFPDNTSTTWSFKALITDFEPGANVEDDLNASLTLKVTGKPTLT